MCKYLLRFKGLFALSAGFTIADAFANVYFAIILKMVIDTATSKSLDSFYNAILIAIAFLVANVFISYMRKLCQSLYIKNTLVSIRNDIFHKILRKDIKSYLQENSAGNISILTNDVGILEQDYLINILDLIYNGVAFAVAVVAIINISIYITVAVLVISALPIIISVIFGKKVSMSKKHYSDTLSVFTGKIKDVFSGFEVIKSFNIEDKIENEYGKSNRAVEGAKYKFNLISTLADTLSGATGFLMFLAALGIGTYFVIKGQITIGSMIATVQLMNSIVGPIMMVSQKLNRLNSVKLIDKKISDIVEGGVLPEEGIHKNVFSENIAFDNVGFCYEADKNVLSSVSFDIRKGLKYAVVGESGSGKSTLLKLLLRYYEDFGGSISIDGTDIRQIDINDLYSLISVIQQNVFMFDATVRENITLYGSYEEAEIQHAVRLSGIEKLIKNLPDGVDSLVGENGCNFSGGERQRIAIARALIKKTPVLILDEATSALDNETAYSIEKTLLSIQDLTCLVVTHKLIAEILRKYDGILVMKNGRVEEMGSFDELIERKGYFYSLYNVAKDE